VLTIADHLIDRLLGLPSRSALRLGRPTSSGDRGRRLEIDLPIGPTFVAVSKEVERQYLRILFQAADGDLDRMARELLGPRASGRQMHLRLNQLGMRLRELKGIE
jgi:hypothetical protein